MTACQALSSALTNKGMTPQQLASTTGSDQARIAQICAGSVTPTNEEYSKISAALGLGIPANHPR